MNEVEITADGSATIYVPHLDEHYHSVKGALTESLHIFRNCAFLYHSPSSQPLRVLEIGFGTGLNAVVTAMATTKGRKAHYISLELYPVEAQLIEKLNYGEMVDNDLLMALHQAQWNAPQVISPTFTLEKLQCDFTQCSLPHDIDVVYFDAFAPEKQPEMWDESLFKRIYDAMSNGGILTTYCAKGEIRRRLQRVGFIVERLAGPPGGKREILRATKPSLD
jgi:tRNA U34 5-methylaminomethyl-2-thiouridine-forming methyltransferase MnmC